MKNAWCFRIPCILGVIVLTFLPWALSFAGPEVELSSPVGRGLQPHSPPLPGTGFALEFRLLPARAPAGPTVALFGALRAGRPYAERYGGRLAGAVRIVAVDPENGRVFQGTPERPGTAPLVPLSDREIEKQAHGDATVEEIVTYFHLDLVNQLGLPRESGKWKIFLWLDDRLSAMQEVNLPGPLAGERGRPATNGKSKHLRVQVAERAAVTTVQPGTLELRNPKGSSPSPGRIHGGIHFGPGLPPDAKWLTVLSLCQQTRRLRYESVPLPPGAEGSAGVSFDFDSSALAGCGPKDERAFFVAVCGSALSRALILERRR